MKYDISLTLNKIALYFIKVIFENETPIFETYIYLNSKILNAFELL
jgi:hypothetical protein